MDCRTCKYAEIDWDKNIFCYINVPDDVFMLGCGHAECPYYEESEDDEEVENV